MSGSQSVTLKASGLSTYANPLGSVQEGSMADAVNVVIDRNNVVEPRRGITQYGTSFGDSTDRTHQLFNYKDVIIRHVLDKLQYDSDGNGTFATFAGDSVNEIVNGLRLKAVEANGNFYFVTDTGVQKIVAQTSADFPTASIQYAGGVEALDLIATVNYSTAGFLEANSKAGYRVVWGIKDANSNLILGTPSSRSVVYNVSTTSSAIVDLQFSIPNDVNSTSYFYQVYRTGIFQGDLPPVVVFPQEPADPGDEMNLVFEDNVTLAQLAAGEILVQDITPADFARNGTPLYTNPLSGDGIESANAKPPFAQDITSYKNYTFYSNTKTVQQLNLSFLSVQDIVNGTSELNISDGTTTTTYTFQGSNETYSTSYTGAVSTDFYNASLGPAKYFTLTSANDARTYLFYFYQGTDDQTPVVSGTVNVKITILAADTVSQILDKMVDAIYAATNDFNISATGLDYDFACSDNGAVSINATSTLVFTGTPQVITRDNAGTGEDIATKKIFLPRVPTGTENGPTTSQQLEEVARSAIRVINANDPLVYAYYISGSNDIPGQILFKRRTTTGSAFYLTSNVGQEFTPTLPTSGSDISSTNEISPNRIFFSKIQQPEAVPLVNYFDVGPKDREIKRIIGLRDSLFIFKEDGIYRLSGETSDSFVIAAFDFSAQVLAPDTAVVLNNEIWALSTQGVIKVTDTGVNVMSRSIENKILSITRSNFAYKTASFGVSYETDRSYLLYTVTTDTDQVATQCFRYNTFTNAWTRWNTTQTCGLVNFANNTLYVGAGDTNLTEKERKNLNRSDHADRQYDLSLSLNGVNGSVLTITPITQVEVGDVLIQKQYLTEAQFNRLLDKLDRDISVQQHDYMTLEYSPGQDMRVKLLALAAKMDTDTGIQYSQFLSDINSYTYNVASKATVGSNTVITTTVPHSIKPTRYIAIAGLENKQVLSVTSNTLTIAGVLNSTPSIIQTANNDFRDMQACFNIMINVLNVDDGVFYSNYPLSNGSVEFEVVITAFNKATNTVTIKTPEQFLFGTITLYKAIKSKIIWNPSYFGDPTLFKQVREGTMIFENSNFSKVTISYGTDLSPSMTPIVFQGPGLSVGDWGYFNFGTINWGGVAAPIPLRTYVPGPKQRCRFMVVQFDHSVAFEKYAIYGVSLNYRPYSTRAYK